MLEKLNLAATFEFVPFSASRNKDSKYKNLNYKVTLLRNNKPFLITDYQMGSGFAPAYKGNFSGNKDAQKDAIYHECETGREAIFKPKLGNDWYFKPGKAIVPNAKDVYYSIVLDCDVLNYGDFTEWASGFGYDSDSIKAKEIYDACLSIALKVRSTIGEDGINSLKEYYEDY